MTESYISSTHVGPGLNKITGGYFFKIVGGPRQLPGISDFVGMLNGQFIGVEVKVDGNVLSSRQEVWKRKMLRHGGVYIELYYMNDTKLATAKGYKGANMVWECCSLKDLSKTIEKVLERL